MRVWAALMAAIFLGTFAPAESAAATYSGVLATPGVAWISDGSKPAPLAEREIRQHERSFVPTLLVITAGTPVRFPNDDGFYHSVFSDSPADPFDLGLYDMGPGKSMVFANPGVVGVRCHVHGSMSATIVVVDGPVAQTTQTKERYRLTGVAKGKHRLHTWTPEAGETVKTVVIR